MPQMIVEIFEPSMCCASGMCGPEPDADVLAINQVALEIETNHSGKARMQRYLLNQAPQEFAKRAAIMKLLQDNGVAVLPITCINGEVVKKGKYPALAEILAYLPE